MEACAEEDQAQSLSGVARTERVIQMIMYMTRTFMLHVVLHWSKYGVDNLSL